MLGETLYAFAGIGHPTQAVSWSLVAELLGNSLKTIFLSNTLEKRGFSRGRIFTGERGESFEYTVGNWVKIFCYAMFKG